MYSCAWNLENATKMIIKLERKRQLQGYIKCISLCNRVAGVVITQEILEKYQDFPVRGREKGILSLVLDPLETSWREALYFLFTFIVFMASNNVLLHHKHKYNFCYI